MPSPVSSSTRRSFLLRLASATAAIPCAASAAASVSPLTSVPPARLAKLATGANVCLWFRYADRKSRQHFESYLPDDEARVMAEMGIKHVRLCVHPKVIMDMESGEIFPARMEQLDAAIKRFHHHGLLVVVDLHNEDHDKEPEIAWQERLFRFWQNFARRLSAQDPGLTVLEIMNEPVFWNETDSWNRLQSKIAGAIRAEAPEHTIIASGARWGGIDGLKVLKPLDDRNIVYSFHCYDPMPFTHQGATWSSEEMVPLRNVPYPSSPEAVEPLFAGLENHPGARDVLVSYGQQRWNKEKLAARFQEAVTWGKTHGVPLYCGEFGVYPRHARPDHRAEWFRDFGGILSSQSIGWAVWGWDEGFGLNRRYRDGKLSVDPVVAGALGFKAIP